MVKQTDTTAWETRVRQNTIHLATWTGIWLLTTALAAFGPILLWNEAVIPSLLAILLNLATGIGMIMTNKRYLQGLDELQQRMILEAMALSLGIGLIAGIAYSMLDIANLISFDAEISHLILVMGLSYVLGYVYASRRYQ